MYISKKYKLKVYYAIFIKYLGSVEWCLFKVLITAKYTYRSFQVIKMKSQVILYY